MCAARGLLRVRSAPTRAVASAVRRRARRANSQCCARQLATASPRAARRPGWEPTPAYDAWIFAPTRWRVVQPARGKARHVVRQVVRRLTFSPHHGGGPFGGCAPWAPLCGVRLARSRPGLRRNAAGTSRDVPSSGPSGCPWWRLCPEGVQARGYPCPSCEDAVRPGPESCATSSKSPTRARGSMRYFRTRVHPIFSTSFFCGTIPVFNLKGI